LFRESRVMGFLPRRFAQMAVKIAHAERYADIVLGERLAGRAYDPRLFFQTSRSKRNIGRDGDIACFDMFGDPVIGRVRSFRRDHMTDERIGIGAKRAIADDDDVQAVAGCDLLHLRLHRTGIAIDVNIQPTPFLFFTKSSTTEGSASVLVSPRLEISFSAILRKMRRMILPERVLGRPGANWMTSGRAMGLI